MNTAEKTNSDFLNFSCAVMNTEEKTSADFCNFGYVVVNTAKKKTKQILCCTVENTIKMCNCKLCFLLL